MRRRAARSEVQPIAPDDVFGGLRATALAAVERGLADPAPQHPNVLGAVADIPAEGGYATLVALNDDTTSLYTSTGGGTIGAGAYPAVAAATHDLLAAIERQLDLFAPRDDDTLPRFDTVRFHVLTTSRRRVADVPADAFWGRADHPLGPVIAAAQTVIGTLRAATSD